MNRFVMPLADGVEEMEAVILLDVLRRAGWTVTAAGIGGRIVTAARGVGLVADCLWEDLGDPDTLDGIVIPGGMAGTRALCAFDPLLDTLRRYDRDQKWIGAICAGPLVLQAAGILAGRRFTCYPGIEKEIRDAEAMDAPVIRDQRLITSRGPGTAFAFALEFIAAADHPDRAAAIRRQLVLAGDSVA